jgi:hypothetical protein
VGPRRDVHAGFPSLCSRLLTPDRGLHLAASPRSSLKALFGLTIGRLNCGRKTVIGKVPGSRPAPVFLPPPVYKRIGRCSSPFHSFGAGVF